MSEDYLIDTLGTPERVQEFKALTNSGALKCTYAQWLESTFVEPTEDTPTVVPPANRTSFIEALEAAFWEANGPELLTKLARTNHLEFLKICARLIPVDATAKTSKGGLYVSFNFDKQEVESEAIDVDAKY